MLEKFYMLRYNCCMIEMQNVTVKYVREFYALLNYNSTFENNTLLLGENGKVVLRLLAGMDRYAGNILYDGANLKEIDSRNFPFAYLPEQPVLFKHKSVYKNLIFPLKMRKIKNADEIVENALAAHLSFLIEKTKTKNEIGENSNENFLKIKKLKAGKLNKDDQQILCLTRAVIRQPKYLLVDNLFSTLSANYHRLAATILSKYTGTIIAAENKPFNFYKNFTSLQINN